MNDMINMTVRLRDEATPKRFGTVVDETADKVRVDWGNGTRSWVSKRDLVVLG